MILFVLDNMRTLSSVFEQTNNLCFYKFNSSVSGIFPKVNTLTLIHCKNIPLILHSAVFPNLKRINYLSVAPTELIHYPKVSWVFPTINHSYYRTMAEAGAGFIDEDLIPTYIHTMKRINGNMEIALTIPDYGRIDGEVYHSYLSHYFMKNKIGTKPFNVYYNETIKRNFMEFIHDNSKP